MAEADDSGMELPLDSVGQKLLRAREAAGLDRKQLSERTRITSRHIELIEAGNFAGLPGRPYAVGFARSYARAVGLDETAVAEAVRLELDAASPAKPSRPINQFEVGDPAKTPSARVVVLAALLSIAVVLAGIVLWRSQYLPATELPSLVKPENPALMAQGNAPAANAPRQADAPSAPSGGPVVFTATDDRVWVKFADAKGGQVMQKEMARGESYTLPGDVQGITIRTARPDALDITVGGRAVPRLADTQSLIRDMPVSAAALQARTRAAPAPASSPTGSNGTQGAATAL